MNRSIACLLAVAAWLAPASAVRASTTVTTRGPARAAAPAPAASPAPAPAGTLLDGFDDSAPWTAKPADGVSLVIGSDAGVRGKSLRLDFDFHGGGGYAVAHRAVSFDLPANYRFTFKLRGSCPPNNLEFKLIDDSGDDVWWCNTRDFEFPREWSTHTIRRRNVSFAWGPRGGGELRHVAAIEFAVTAGQGGRGTVWLDDLALEALPPPDTLRHAVVVHASSELAGRPASYAADSNATTYWSSRPADALPWLAIDFGAVREFGGIVIDWMPGEQALNYRIDVAGEARDWTTVRNVRGSDGGRDAFEVPDGEARYVRISCLRRMQTVGVSIAEVRLLPLAAGASPNDFMESLAHDAPRGLYPRAFRGEQPYWTVVGQDDDDREALLDEDGRLETGPGAFSIEPFLYTDGRLVTWADVAAGHTLAGGDLPVPTATWAWKDLRMSVTAFGSGDPGRSSVLARYRVRNTGPATRPVTLDLALRPFQVNPPTQFLGVAPGVAPIRDMAIAGRVVRVNGDRGIVSLTPPTGFGALAWEQGDVVDYLAEGRLPAQSAAKDSVSRRASGALAYALTLAPGEEREVDVIVPLHDPPAEPAFAADTASARAFAQDAQAASEAGWRERLERVTIELPDSAMDVVNALRAQIGWVLVNRAGPAIQPGSRAYARSWIRDGCLTSSALLRMGETQAVRDFLEWYAPHQYGNGKAPCCVDARGSDPVPEHDSSGEFVYLVAEYVRYTGDNAMAQRMWPRVAAAVGYLDSLRQTRRTPEWSSGDNARFHGLLPPSISHEGYSAKPMHSYWDDLFALRGFKDAAWLAALLGRPERARLEGIRDEFQRDLVASYRATMAAKHIDWLAGCADLGDFDATSTSIALEPVNAETALPDSALRATFDRYWAFFRRRERGEETWDAFTPYEWRNVGAFVRLGERDRAQEALRWLMRYRRPQGWNEWAEVVERDARAPRFLGDMPHTWVGTDYVRSVLDMIAYEREADSSIVIGAGVPQSWLADSGLVVRNLRTRWGPLSYTLHGARGGRVELSLEDSGLRVPPGGIVLDLPLGAEGRGSAGIEVTERGVARPVAPGAVVIHALPARVLATWEGAGRR